MLADAQNAKGKNAAAYRSIIQAEKLAANINEDEFRAKAFIVVARTYLRLHKSKVFSGFTNGLTEREYQRHGRYDEYLTLNFLFP